MEESESKYKDQLFNMVSECASILKEIYLIRIDAANKIICDPNNTNVKNHELELDIIDFYYFISILDRL